MRTKKVYISVLNMGLGHASRTFPVIKEFLDRGWQVLVGSNGRALHFIKSEFPSLPFVHTPDYKIEYSRKGVVPLKVLQQVPRVLSRIAAEYRLTRKVVQQFKPDLIFSDHCYGAYHVDIPSVFLTSQIYFAMPAPLRRLRRAAAIFNFYFHRKYTRVLIPDLPLNGSGLLSGELTQLPANCSRYHFVGILSSLPRGKQRLDLDLLIAVSGPEPQRSVFENLVRQHLSEFTEKTVLVLGKPDEREKVEKIGPVQIFNHVSRDRMSEFLQRSAMVVCRSGYSTLMELAALGKKALFVPTPGQTEQEYLAERAMNMGWFYSVRQDELNLPQHLGRAKLYPGIRPPIKASKTPRTILEICESLL